MTRTARLPYTMQVTSVILSLAAFFLFVANPALC